MPRFAIVTQPEKAAVCLPGGSVTVSVTAAGEGLTYQWKAMNAAGQFVDIPGATKAAYTRTNIQASDMTNMSSVPCLPLYCEVRDSAGNTLKTDAVNIYLQEEKMVFTGLDLPAPGKVMSTSEVPGCNVGTVRGVLYAQNHKDVNGQAAQPKTQYTVAFRIEGEDDFLKASFENGFVPVAEWNGLTCTQPALYLPGRGYYILFEYTTPSKSDLTVTFTGGSLPEPGKPLDTTKPVCSLGTVGGIVWRVNGKEVTGPAQPGTTYQIAILLVKTYEDSAKIKAVWNGLETSKHVKIEGRGTVFEFTYTTPGSADPGTEAKITLSPDGKSASVTGGHTGLYARVALILDNNGVTGLYVTQAAIGADGTVTVPSMMVPGLKVKGVNIALVPTLADIQSPTPKVISSAFMMY